jgi:hypothetical protein
MLFCFLIDSREFLWPLSEPSLYLRHGLLATAITPPQPTSEFEGQKKGG